MSQLLISIRSWDIISTIKRENIWRWKGRCPAAAPWNSHTAPSFNTASCDLMSREIHCAVSRWKGAEWVWVMGFPFTQSISAMRSVSRRHESIIQHGLYPHQTIILFTAAICLHVLCPSTTRLTARETSAPFCSSSNSTNTLMPLIPLVHSFKRVEESDRGKQSINSLTTCMCCVSFQLDNLS